MQELNIEQIESVSGGDILTDWLIGKALDLALTGWVDWANAGAGIGGRMDKEGKLG